MKLLPHRRMLSPRRVLILACLMLSFLIIYFMILSPGSVPLAPVLSNDLPLDQSNKISAMVKPPVMAIVDKAAPPSLYDMDCIVEDSERVACIRRGAEVYVPFDYLKRRYELSGGLADDGRLHWYASYARLHPPRLPYSPYGAFLHFADYSVERRDRVLRISGRRGVPVSQQWDRRGHEYVIQVAQYGLSHFSKAETQQADSSRSGFVNSGDASATRSFGESTTDWTVPDGAQLMDVAVNATFSPPRPVVAASPGDGSLLHFNVPADLSRGARLNLARESLASAGRTVLRLVDFLSVAGASVTVQLVTNRRGTVRLHYGVGFVDDYRAPGEKTDIYYAVGLPNGEAWRTLTRNLAIDVEKAFVDDDDDSDFAEDNSQDGEVDNNRSADASEAADPGVENGDEESHRRRRRRDASPMADEARRKLRASRGRRGSRRPGGRRRRRGGGGGGPPVTIRRVQWISLRGVGYLGRVEFVTPAAARPDFYRAAGDWLVANQNASTGAWPIRARREIGRRRRRQVLQPGWCSAMGQGQAISLLVRLHHRWPNRRDYLTAAVRGLAPFQRDAASNPATGVTARLFDRLTWYEEYPVPGGLFVLNGFIYSLFGLYDLRHLLAELTAKADGQVIDGVSLRAHLANVSRLYSAGIESLKSAIGLFDHGDGTYYDLRHVTNPDEEPRRARWDYHSVHVTQLQALTTLEPDPGLLTALTRWEKYMHGYRVGHN